MKSYDTIIAMLLALSLIVVGCSSKTKNQNNEKVPTNRVVTGEGRLR